MKKSLIALAALSAFATAAQAQSSVTVYGVMDINYSSKDGGSGASTYQNENALATSRIGFKGTEDLGGGLKAEFQLESKITPTVAASQTFGREQWVGLSSTKLGSLRMGVTDVTSAQAYDTAVSQMGDLGNTVGDVGADSASTVRYTTPTFSGLTAEIGYSNPDSTAAGGVETTTNRITSAALKYSAGKLNLFAGSTEKKINATYDQKDVFLGGTYDFGIASVGVGRRVLDATTSTLQNANGDFTQTVYSVAAPVAMLGSGVKFHAAYAQNESDKAARTSLTADLKVVDSDKTTVALTKAFSKRTTGYVAYIDTSFDTTANKDTKQYSVGVLHTF